MCTFDQLRTDVLALFDRMAALTGTADATTETTDRRAADARERLVAGQLTVAVCGEFKQGKSTLLGALLDDPDLFPADTLPATNNVTTVCWGPAEQITVTVTDEDGQEHRIDITRAQLPDYVTETGNPGNTRRVLLVEIRTPNPKLASGLVFVDTPGVDGVFAEHTAATLAYLPEADALLFVTDVEKPLLDSELAFLRRAIDAASLTGDVEGLLCALTKIDQDTDYSGLIADLRAKLTELTGLPEGRIPIVPISAWEKVDYLADGDPRSLANSNFPELEAALWSTLDRRRARVLLGDALRGLSDDVVARLRPIRVAEQAAADATGATLADLRHQASLRKDQLTALAEDTKTWTEELTGVLRGAQNRLLFQAEVELDKNWNRFHTEYVYDTALLNDPDRLVAHLGADLSALIGALLKLVRTGVAEAMERFSLDKQFTLDPPPIDQLPDLPLPSMPADASAVGSRQEHSGVLIARYTATAAGIGSTLGALLGAALGTVAAPGPGTVAGAMAGASTGVFIGTAVGGVLAGLAGFASAARMVRVRAENRRRTEIVAVLSRLKITQKAYLAKLIPLAFEQIRPAAVAELRSRLAQEQETVENILRRLDDQQRSAQEDLAADRERFAAERAPYDDLLDDIDDALLCVERLRQGAPCPADDSPSGTGDTRTDNTDRTEPMDGADERGRR